jgi:hypothetical protein
MKRLADFRICLTSNHSDVHYHVKSGIGAESEQGIVIATGHELGETPRFLTCIKRVSYPKIKIYVSIWHIIENAIFEDTQTFNNLTAAFNLKFRAVQL